LDGGARGPGGDYGGSQATGDGKDGKSFFSLHLNLPLSRMAGGRLSLFLTRLTKKTGK
jgi:hypothetical protein